VNSHSKLIDLLIVLMLECSVAAGAQAVFHTGVSGVVEQYRWPPTRP